MDIPCTLAIFKIKALNDEGNTLTLEAFEKYLNSPMWKYQKDAKNILGGITHLLRNDAGSEEGMGNSDALFKRGVITHCLKDMWISDDKQRVEGTLEVFDDLSLYSEEQKSDIMQLLRLLKNKVHVGLSLLINGDWDDDDGHLVEIIEIMGVDATLDPAFIFTETKQGEVA